MLAAFLLWAILLNTLAACGAGPTPTLVADASPEATSPPPTSAPTQTALPTVPAVAPQADTAPPEIRPSATPSRTVSPTASAAPSAAPSASPTASPTGTAPPAATQPPVSPAPSITPTATITSTPTPTLTPTPIYSPTPLPTATYSGEVVHFLLVGLDAQADLGRQNTDVILVALVNKDTKQVSMLSIPRDLWVYIPTYGWSRINVAHKIGHRTGYPGGGPGLLGDTIEMNFGIPIDHWVRMDFQGFARVVDELGGVEMAVACPVNLRYKPPKSEDEEEMILEPGIYHMDGATALRYVRTRRDGTDFDRSPRQHQFLKAVWNQAKSADIVFKIPGLWSALADSFKTDMNVGDALSLAPVALEIKPQRIRSRYIGPNQVVDWTNAEGWRVLVPDYDKIQEVVASLYAPPSAAEDQLAKEGARIQVRNGTYRPQLAMLAADQLRWHGLKIVDTAPADSPEYPQTQIIVYNEKPLALDLLIRQLEVKPENVIYQLDPNQPADILVILGQDYDPCR